MTEDKKPFEKEKIKFFVLKNVLIFFSVLWIGFFLYPFMPDWAKVPFMITFAVLIAVPIIILLLLLIAYVAKEKEV